MKFYLTLLLTFLVEAQIFETDKQVVQRVCKGNPSVITVDNRLRPTWEKRVSPFSKKQNVDECRKQATTKVFTTLTLTPSSAAGSPSALIVNTKKETSVFKVKDYFVEESNFYDGVSLDITQLDKEDVGRLAESIPTEKTIALVYDLERWESITEEVKKIKARIDHVVLRVDKSNYVEGMILKVVESYPSTIFSVMGIDKDRFEKLQAEIYTKYPSKELLYSGVVAKEKLFSYFKTDASI
ncbi:hypothetical protein DSO57_1035940 [Entomophthora muscae]|uniref:Uncharacterized protein n=1 Tax=Entomophthora muscae TaxID=34485 RepID=A0ACC2TXX3_9FUNG|nr:hypothetical protein DSO57_1035940 [Entomophthora muscae]